MGQNMTQYVKLYTLGAVFTHLAQEVDVARVTGIDEGTFLIDAVHRHRHRKLFVKPFTLCAHFHHAALQRIERSTRVGIGDRRRRLRVITLYVCTVYIDLRQHRVYYTYAGQESFLAYFLL